jgi:hypothetical protein
MNSIWRDKVSAVNDTVKDVALVPLKGIVEVLDRMESKDKFIFACGIATEIMALAISINGYCYIEENFIDGLATFAVGASAFCLSPYLHSEEIKNIFSEMKYSINTIDYEYSDLMDEVYLREAKLKEGQRDFKSLLVSSNGKLCPDMIGMIGQEIFDSSIKESQ